MFVTCPPMLGLIDEFEEDFRRHNLVCTPAEVSQTLSEDALIEQLPRFDGWIIGDDPATRRVVAAAAGGKLRAAVKWGVGVDNVDFTAFADHGIPVENTPGVFGNEVADVALTYTLGLARETYLIDREIRTRFSWPKPSGLSMTGKTVAIAGFGDIGRETARRIIACGARVIAYDPAFKPVRDINVQHAEWPERIDEADFIIFTCPLNSATRAMFNFEILNAVKPGVRIVNVSRGPVILEAALVDGLKTGKVHSAALDVFEAEPLEKDSPLRDFEKCIFGSHNGSNTVDAVRRVSRLAIQKIAGFLEKA